MEIKIHNSENFAAKNNSLISVGTNFKNVSITLPRKKLVFRQGETELGKYESDHAIYYVEYEDRLICYLKDGKSKRISFEVFGLSNQLNEVKKNIILRNRIALYKSTLQREYSVKYRESLMVNKHKSLNGKGFLNLTIIFLVLNYIRLIFESKNDNKFVFVENVG